MSDEEYNSDSDEDYVPSGKLSTYMDTFSQFIFFFFKLRKKDVSLIS